MLPMSTLSDMFSPGHPPSALSHEQVHKMATENIRPLRQNTVFHGFQSYFRIPIFTGG